MVVIIVLSIAASVLVAVGPLSFSFDTPKVLEVTALAFPEIIVLLSFEIVVNLLRLLGFAAAASEPFANEGGSAIGNMRLVSNNFLVHKLAQVLVLAGHLGDPSACGGQVLMSYSWLGLGQKALGEGSGWLNRLW